MSRIVWLTGLSGAGKTTLAWSCAEQMRAVNIATVVIDGDEFRKVFCPDLGFSKEDRAENNHRMGVLARLLAANDITVLVAAISPYAVTREAQRQLAQDAGIPFVEVFVSCPMEILEQRDTKGMYGRSRRGEFQGLTGVSAPYEPPQSPDVVVHTDTESIHESTRKIICALAKRCSGCCPGGNCGSH